MLIGAPDWLIPTLALKFFSGLRTEEMVRLKWEDVKFDQDVILLSKQVTKTKQRRIVPLLPNLKIWLASHRLPEGLIAARWVSAHTLSKAWSNRAADVDVAYKKNGMRNSYISSRVASTKNIAQVYPWSKDSSMVGFESTLSTESIGVREEFAGQRMQRRIR